MKSPTKGNGIPFQTQATIQDSNKSINNQNRQSAQKTKNKIKKVQVRKINLNEDNKENEYIYVNGEYVNNQNPIYEEIS